MKTSVHLILLIATLLPLAGLARDETPQERKQRIMRKYLRERATTVQSGMMVPEDEPEDDDLQDSERFTEAEVNIARQDSVTIPPPQMRRPAPQKTQDRNWLLAEQEDQKDPLANPYQDPFARPEQKEESSASFPWEYAPEKSSSLSAQKQEDFRRDDRRSSLFGRQNNGLIGFNTTPQQRASTAFDRNLSTLGNISGQNRTSSSKTPSFTNPFSLTTPSGSSRNQNRNDLRFGSDGQTFGSDSRTFGSDSREQLRVPYSMPGNSLNTPQYEYQQQSPFEKWQKNRKPMENSPFKK